MELLFIGVVSMVVTISLVMGIYSTKKQYQIKQQELNLKQEQLALEKKRLDLEEKRLLNGE